MQLNKNTLQTDFTKFSSEWINTSEYNEHIYNYFEQQVSKTEALSTHNDVVAKYQLGYGEKAFRYLWALVFSQIPSNGKFLEIGVYKGSVLALSQLVSKELDLNIQTFGLTPLNNTGDKYSTYPLDNYEYAIAYLYNQLKLDISNTQFIQGLSTDTVIKQVAKEQGPYNVIYIDGGHDYDTVISDINLSDEMLVPGGLLVMDDASSNLNFKPTHGFTGHADVARAIKDRLDEDNRYKHLFACGHNRVWIKNK